jgi:O-antigen ligase
MRAVVSQQGAVRAAGLAMAVLLALAPLEFRETTPFLGLQLSLPELLAGAAAVAGLLAVKSLGWLKIRPARTVLEHHEAWPARALIAWGILHLASMTWAPPDPTSHASVRGYVAKFALRVTGGVMLALVAWKLSELPAFRRRMASGLLVGLAIITVLAVCERLLGRAFEPWLQYFRDEPTWMLGEQRLSTVFYHANTQAAYFELTAPFLLVLAASPGRPLWQRVGLGAWLVLDAILLSLTYSRAGLLAAVAGALVLVLAARPGKTSGSQAKRPALAWLAGLYAIAVVGAYFANPDMRARVGLTDRSYQARYTFEKPCVGHAGTVIDLPVLVRNLGEWSLSNRQAPGTLIHRWLTLDGQRLPGRWVRDALPEMPPGSHTRIHLHARLPDKPAAYALAVDVNRDDVLRISALGNPMGLVQCIAAAPGEDLSTYAPPGALPPMNTSSIASVRHLELERPQYWRAALLLFARRPWLGWGDDRFRLLYHEYVPHEAFDERARAHSWLIETAVDLGLAGVAVLALLAFVVGRAGWRLMRRGEREVDGPSLAAAAALTGLAVHMQVDYFLAYTKVAMLFWPLVGLLCGAARRRPEPACPLDPSTSTSSSTASGSSTPPT